MNPRVLPALLVLVLAGCFPPKVDYTGKTCASDAECGEGFTCVAGACAPAGTAAPPDAGTIEQHDAGETPPDAGTTPDAGDAPDAGSPDAGEAPDAGSPDGGSGPCRTDQDCSSKGAFRCDSSGECVPCDTDQACGLGCLPCAAGSRCTGGACEPCDDSLACGASCQACSAPTGVCDGTGCVECTTGAHCPQALPGCAGGHCVECTADAMCPTSKPACVNNRCVACAKDAQCPTATPACDTATNTCVRCTSNASCPQATPVCDEPNRCVECLADANCPTARPHCAGNVCVACTADAQCGSGKLCVQNQCVACNTSAHCGATCGACSAPTNVCDGTACVECTSAAQCPTALPGCAAGKCVECTADAMCPSTAPVCNPATHSCVRCLSNASCPQATPVCDAPNRCVECLGDVNCPFLRPHCLGNVCVACTADQQCGSGYVCSQNQCVACNTADHCGATCATCDAPTNVCDGTACVECTSPSQCPSGLPGCAGGKCVECSSRSQCPADRPACVANHCVACDSDADCPSSTPACDTTQNRCVRCLTAAHCAAPTPVCAAPDKCVECTSDANCPANKHVCSNNVCVACVTDSQCPTANPACVNNTCVPCNDNADCSPGSFCSQNQCTSCNSSSQCGASCQPCPSTSPICSSGSCVECTSDANCSAPKGKCSVNKCVECTADTDCTGGKACCGGSCVATGKPTVVAVDPPVVDQGSTTGPVRVVGTGFMACTAVKLNGTSVPVSRVVSDTELEISVSAALRASPAMLVLQAENPGSAGPSDPPQASLGARVPVAFIQSSGGDTSATMVEPGHLVVVSDSNNRTIGVVDGTALTLKKTLNSTAQGRVYGLWALGSRVYVGGNNTTLEAIDDIGNLAVSSSINTQDRVASFDANETVGKAALGSDTRRYAMLPLPNGPAGAAISFNSGNVVGVALNADGSLLAVGMDNGDLYVGAPGTNLGGNPVTGGNKIKTVAADRVHGSAWVARSDGLGVFDFATSTETPASQLPGFVSLALNPKAGLGVGVSTRAGAPSLDLLDLAGRRVVGSLGTGDTTNCGDLPSVAYDTTTNRAYRVHACSGSVEAFHLNMLMVAQPAPTITSLSPASTPAGRSANLTVRISGTNFNPSTTVSWVNGAETPLTITAQTATTLDVTLPSSLTTCGGPAAIKVSNPQPGGGSDSKTFNVTAATPVLSTAVTSPSSCSYLSTTCKVVVTGSSFMPGCSKITVGGLRYVSSGTATQLTTTGYINAATAAGTQNVYVYTPGGGNSATLTINRP